MDNSIHLISLDKIKPEFDFKITDIFLERMKKSEDLSTFDLLLAVQKEPFTKDSFLLVGGFDRFHYLKYYTDKKYAHCIIEDFREENKRWAKILQRFIPKGDDSKPNRLKVIEVLKKAKESLDTIIQSTGLTTNYFKSNYQYNKLINDQYINYHTTEKTLNWIHNLKIDHEVKDFLFKKAGLPKGHPNRLTDDSRKIINNFLKMENRINQLPISEQIRILKYATNFKGMVITFLIEMVDDLIRKQRRRA
jgi:hypothetical protein